MSLIDMSSEKPPGYAEENNSRLVTIPVTVFTVVCPILMGLRIWARRTTRGVAFDDWVGLAALLFALVTNGLFYGAVHHGFGKHSDALEHESLKKVLLLWWLLQQIYKISLNLTKISLLLLYMRIFSHVVWFRTFARSLIVFLILYVIGTCSAGFAQCRPVRRVWDKTVDGTCLDVYIFFNANGIIAMVTDVIILVLPFPLVYKLSLPLAQKLALIPVFGLGSVICVASALRVYSLIAQLTPDSDRTYDLLSTMWTIIEYNLALVCLCLPSVRVLLVKRFPLYFRSASSRGSNVARSGGGLGGTGVRGTWLSGSGGENGGSRARSRADGGGDLGGGVKIGNRYASRKQLEDTESQEEILDQTRGGGGAADDVEFGAAGGRRGIKKTVKYEVEFEMVDSPKGGYDLK
ncbi:hypothetical protein QBC43DRAFT_268175 [Cladorrhinum sp. PSN259]|nr:hypothetical protein QBC43DRAFT_268175 [Cladorrhinum sp. PSN259]